MVKSVAAVVVLEEQVLVVVLIFMVAMELEYQEHGTLLK